jgi:excisionase family DNA binding protein
MRPYGAVCTLTLKFPCTASILIAGFIILMREGGIMSPSYLTVKQFSEQFNVSTSLTYRLIHSGDLEAIRIGKKSYRIPPDKVHFVQGRKVLP